MKKLMIAAAIVCAAAFAQASSFCWGFQSGETKAIDGEYFGEGAYADATAFLFLGAVTVESDQWKFADGAKILATGNMNAAPAYNWGYFNDSTIAGMPTSEDLDIAGGDPITLILLDGVVEGTMEAFKAYEGNYIIGDKSVTTATAIAGTTPQPYLLAVDSNTYGAGDWNATPQGVPEPTSGLLMLLGMGALALRRRRA